MHRTKKFCLLCNFAINFITEVCSTYACLEPGENYICKNSLQKTELTCSPEKIDSVELYDCKLLGFSVLVITSRVTLHSCRVDLAQEDCTTA